MIPIAIKFSGQLDASVACGEVLLVLGKELRSGEARGFLRPLPFRHSTSLTLRIPLRTLGVTVIE